MVQQLEGKIAAVTGAELQAPLIQGGHVRYANLDYGASAPALTIVSAYLNEVLPYYASVHRGAGFEDSPCSCIVA